MPTLGRDYLATVLGTSEPPCVSVYMPTHRSYPDAQQDRIRYKDLVRQVEDRLAKTHPGQDAKAVAAKLHALEGDNEFWTSAKDGLAVLASPSRFDVFKLPRTVPERAEVADSFHVKPLLRVVQSADRFHVLCVSRERAALFEGDRYELHPLHAPGVPLAITAGLADPRAAGERYHTDVTGPGLRTDRVADGRGAREPEEMPERHQFFRAVDRALTDLVSNPTGLPVILIGNAENLAEFRGVAKNRAVLADAVTGDWTRWSMNEIREKAWGVFEKQYLARLAQLKEDFGTAQAHGRGTQDLYAAAEAARMGRIGFLLVDADRTLPGSIDLTTAAVTPGDAEAGDLLDDLAELAARNGATVIVVPSDRMPTTTGLAAIYRY
jgi:hypothetical protein